MSVNEKMTAIADAIRAKTGGTDKLTLDQMAADIEAIDTSEDLTAVLAEQEALIEEIKVTLESKAAGGGGTNAAYGHFTGDNSSTWKLTGLSFAPHRIAIIRTDTSTATYRILSVRAEKEASAGAYVINATGAAMFTNVTATFADSGIELTVVPIGINFMLSGNYIWIALGE